MAERVIDYSNRDEAVETWRDIIRGYYNGEMGAAALRGFTYHADEDPTETKT